MRPGGRFGPVGVNVKQEEYDEKTTWRISSGTS